MHRHFAKWRLRRLVALATAYALVLSALVGSFATARAADGLSGTPTCHSEVAGQRTPRGTNDGKLCDNWCCVGCLMLMAALPAPPAKAPSRIASVGQIRALPEAANLLVRPAAKSHQSRAPPQTA